MKKPYEILVLASDDQRRDRWVRTLAPRANVSTDLHLLEASEAEMPELIVTDTLPIAAPLGSAATLIARGEIVLVGIGTTGLGDVELPADCSASELRLVCRLSGEIARLRRRLAEECRKQQALRKMAYRDPLTGLANRRRWDQELVARMEQLRAADSAAVMGIVLFDLDFFKPLNDQLGHVAGDTTLRHVAHAMAANLAEQHLAARIGGDEFGVLLSGLLAGDVAEVADLVRRSLKYRPEGAEEDWPPLTASAGVVVVLPTDSVRPLGAMAAADRALRAAKEQGRDRTVMGLLH